MSLWPRNKPLCQPPHYGRVSQRDLATRDDVAATARAAHLAAQFDRQEQSVKRGARAMKAMNYLQARGGIRAVA